MAKEMITGSEALMRALKMKMLRPYLAIPVALLCQFSMLFMITHVVKRKLSNMFGAS